MTHSRLQYYVQYIQYIHTDIEQGRSINDERVCKSKLHTIITHIYILSF